FVSIANDQVRSYVGAPIRVRDEVIGFLNVESATSNFFTAIHAERLRAFADQAAVAIGNAQLFEQVRISSEQLQALSHRLVLVQEDERKLIAADLHDTIVQWLSSALLRGEVLRRMVQRNDPAAANAELKEIETTLQRSIRELRTTIMRLHPPELQQVGLEAMLAHHIGEWKRQHGIAAQLGVRGEAARLPIEVETGLYRICQEALNNIGKHAHAARVEVTLAFGRESVDMCVRDDGVGFHMRTAEFGGRPAWCTADAARRDEHIGLVDMYERAQILGGEFKIESAPGAGTSVSVKIPL
ncbi:MAG: sensor histidine kinase, partial [Chloroflexi bacterium]|nr:sensor histidine kinase [Chloroflexota bacterium]